MVKKDHQTYSLKLMGDNPKNASQPDTRLIQSKVESSIIKYNDMISQKNNINKLDIEQLRDNFISYILEKRNDLGLRTLLTTFITFNVEGEFRNDNFELGVKRGKVEPLFVHLFRGCVLFESLLNRNPNPKPKHDEQKD